MTAALVVVGIVTVVLGVLVAQRTRELAIERTRNARLGDILDIFPVATLVHDERGTVILANAAARELFFEGRDVVGGDFLRMLETAPPALRESVTSASDGIKRLAAEDGGESLLVWRRSVRGLEVLATVPLGDDVARVESEAWRRVLRTLAHEINNTLTPMTTLVATGRVLQPRTAETERLHKIFDTLEERTRHLARFIEQYARVARLPRPTPSRCSLPAMLERVGQMFPGITTRLAAATAYADAAQLEQVVINLVKNAREAAGEAGTIVVVADELDAGTRLQIIDDGPGLAAATLAEVGVPFFTTKESGSGLGLTLCREVVEAHGGRFVLANRGGERGAIATVWLPGPTGGTLRTRLTITRQGAEHAL